MKINSLLKALGIHKEAILAWLEEKSPKRAERARRYPVCFRLDAFLYVQEHFGIPVSPKFMDAPINDPAVQFLIKKIEKVKMIQR